jgi:hypothetical protein
MEGNGTQKKTLSFNLFVKFRGNGTQKDEIFGSQPNFRINKQKNTQKTTHFFDFTFPYFHI